MYFKLYKDVLGQYRWRFISSNGRIIADSGEGYVSEQHAIDGINIITTNAPGAKIIRG